MVQLVVIAMFVVLHLHDAARAQDATPPAGPVLVFVGVGLTGLWLVVQAGAGVASRRLDRLGDMRVVPRMDRLVGLARLAAAGLMAYAILELGWLTLVRSVVGDLIIVDELLAIAPVPAFLAATWWSMYPLEQRLREAVMWRRLHEGAPIHAPPSRAGYVAGQVRHQVCLAGVPLVLVTAWEELIPRIGQYLGSPAPRWWAAAEPFAMWGGVAMLFVLAPGVLRLVWDTVRIGPGEASQQILRVCRAAGVRPVPALLWRTHGTMLNGAIVGVFPPFRYLLLTDALLEHLGPTELEGVVAHEVAHVRNRHVLWMGLVILAVAAVLGWVLAGLQWLGVSPPADSERASAGLSAALLGATLLVFGWVSRRFEWQADTDAVRHLSRVVPDSDAPGAVVSSGAVAAMCGALGLVADMNGVPPDRFDFRHGSIAHRQRRLRALIASPARADSIDRTVRVLKSAAAGVLLATLGAAAWAYFGGAGA